MTLATRPLPAFVQSLELNDPEARVWKVWLRDEQSIDRHQLAALLSADETLRAAQFVFAKDRCRFVVARGALRLLLAESLNESPEVLRFIYGPQGKPELDQRWQGSGVQFNVAHSGDWAVVAMAQGRAVGIDVEQIRADVMLDEVAQRQFSSREAAVLRSLPPERQREAFFRCWTRKEAYLKALGCGLSVELVSFDVSLAPDEPPAILAARNDPQASHRWRMADLQPAEGYAGALVVQSETCLGNLAGAGEPVLR